MTESESTSQLEEIAEEECLEILDRHSLGRIAIVVQAQPQIFPVNYAMSGRVIVFRTASGTKLFHAPEARLAFEIDDYDPSTGVGWSVMVQGIAHDATDSFDDISWAARAVSPPSAGSARKGLSGGDRADQDHGTPVSLAGSEVALAASAAASE